MTREHQINGVTVTIDWSVGGVIDRHDSGNASVWLEGKSSNDKQYHMDASTDYGEISDWDEDTLEEV